MNALLDRRTFVSRFVLGSVTALLAGKLSSTRALGTILAGPAGVLKMKISDYPALASAGGSIRLIFSGSSAHPVLINRGTGDVFYTMDSDCQHAHCVVGIYNPGAGAVVCGCHGSRYAIDGTLLGGPAQRGLNTFLNRFDGVNTLSVTIPGLAFSITDIALQTPAPSLRLRLRTNILPYSTYRVYFQTDLNEPPQVIPFSKTPDGAANVTSAFTTNSPVDLYVDASTAQGFYTVALVASPY